MRTIKKIQIAHRHFIDDCRERMEDYLRKQYHAARVFISDGIAHIEWFAGAGGDYKDVNVFVALLRATFTIKAVLPSNWKEVAEYWIFAGITIQQVEELLDCDIIDIPEKFFEYANKVENDYYDYCTTL